MFKVVSGPSEQVQVVVCSVYSYNMQSKDTIFSISNSVVKSYLIVCTREVCRYVHKKGVKKVEHRGRIGQ